MSAVNSGNKPLPQSDAGLDEAQQFLATCIDSLSSHIAVLDEDGVILAVNAAWRRFADQNGFGGGSYGVGSNYVDACQPTSGEAEDAQAVAAQRRLPGAETISDWNIRPLTGRGAGSFCM